MSTDRNREPEGIPTGGRFAAETRSENVVTLDAPAPVQYTAPLTGIIDLGGVPYGDLPEWPADLGEPHVSFGFSDGKVQTYVTAGDQTMTYWDSDFDGTINDTDTGENPWEDFEDESQELALAWGKEVHERVDSATYGIMIDATNTPQISDLIVAYATGQEPPAGPDLTDKEIREAYIEGAQEQVYRAQRELQQVYLIAAAQELREKHPEIDSFDFSNNGDEPCMDAAWDADGNQIDQGKLDAANHDVFRYRNADDFVTLMSGDPIYVSEAISFRPGA